MGFTQKNYIIMSNTKLQHYFLLALIMGATVLAFFILKPFLYVIILALVSAVIFHPVHKKMLQVLGNHRGFSALATTTVVVVIILIPFVLLGIQIFREASEFYIFIAKGGGKEVIIETSNNALQRLQQYLPFGQTISIDADQYVEQGLSWLLNHFGYLFASTTKLIFNFFIFIAITYYLFKDGTILRKTGIHISPLKDDDDEAILEKISGAINSVVKGSLIVALVQGTLAAIGFAIFGVPNIMLWGAATMVASLIPGIGTALVLIPAVIFVFITKGALLAGGLLAWSILIVGLVDNFLRPKLISDGIKIHPIIVFLSVIGAIALFGPIGFLLGPLAISLLFALYDIYISLKSRAA